MVQLKDFVTESLVQIVEGVQEAKKKVTGGARVAPAPFQPGGIDAAKLGGYLATTKDIVLTQFVEFDVAVTVNEGTKTAGGVGVAIGLVNLGSGGQSTNETSSVSRIKFKIPLALS